MNRYHQEVLALIKKKSGVPTQHTFLDSYLGNDHPRYPINVPKLRTIAKEWMRSHRDLDAEAFMKMLDSLIHGVSSTEKCMAGVLLDASLPLQRKFSPGVFNGWIDQLEGWAEVDSVCTGSYTITEIPAQWKTWKKLLIQFSKSRNINKRRASQVLLCSPLRRLEDDRLLAICFQNIDRLMNERAILITKAISWTLRSAAVHHGALVKKYLVLNKLTLPKIALRETLTLLKTGRKTKPKGSS